LNLKQTLKNLNKKTYFEIKNYLKSNKIDLKSNLLDTDIFYNISSLEKARENDLTFFVGKNSFESLKNTNAKGCLIHSLDLKYLPKNTIPIIVNDVHKSFSLLSNLFNHENREKCSGIISDQSYIDKRSKIIGKVQIDPFVTIKENCLINNNVIIESNCSIGPNVIIGENTIIKSNTTILESKIGSDCIIKSGAIIGGNGFGFDPKSKTRIHHFGDVIIDNNCSIGSNTTIDRAVFDSTIIAENSFIDNLVQIAHNVTIGKDSIIAAQSGIAGSTKIGMNVMIGGQAGISGHLTIGDNVIIAAKSGVTKNLKDNSIVAGFPAVDIKKWKLANIKLNKLK